VVFLFAFLPQLLPRFFHNHRGLLLRETRRDFPDLSRLSPSREAEKLPTPTAVFLFGEREEQTPHNYRGPPTTTAAFLSAEREGTSYNHRGFLLREKRRNFPHLPRFSSSSSSHKYRGSSTTTTAVFSAKREGTSTLTVAFSFAKSGETPHTYRGPSTTTATFFPAQREGTSYNYRDFLLPEKRRLRRLRSSRSSHNCRGSFATTAEFFSAKREGTSHTYRGFLRREKRRSFPHPTAVSSSRSSHNYYRGSSTTTASPRNAKGLPTPTAASSVAKRGETSHTYRGLPLRVPPKTTTAVLPQLPLLRETRRDFPHLPRLSASRQAEKLPTSTAVFLFAFREEQTPHNYRGPSTTTAAFFSAKCEGTSYSHRRFLLREKRRSFPHLPRPPSARSPHNYRGSSTTTAAFFSAGREGTSNFPHLPRLSPSRKAETLPTPTAVLRQLPRRSSPRNAKELPTTTAAFSFPKSGDYGGFGLRVPPTTTAVLPQLPRSPSPRNAKELPTPTATFSFAKSGETSHTYRGFLLREARRTNLRQLPRSFHNYRGFLRREKRRNFLHLPRFSSSRNAKKKPSTTTAVLTAASFSAKREGTSYNYRGSLLRQKRRTRRRYLPPKTTAASFSAKREGNSHNYRGFLLREARRRNLPQLPRSLPRRSSPRNAKELPTTTAAFSFAKSEEREEETRQNHRDFVVRETRSKFLQLPRLSSSRNAKKKPPTTTAVLTAASFSAKREGTSYNHRGFLLRGTRKRFQQLPRFSSPRTAKTAPTTTAVLFSAKRGDSSHNCRAFLLRETRRRLPELPRMSSPRNAKELPTTTAVPPRNLPQLPRKC